MANLIKRVLLSSFLLTSVLSLNSYAETKKLGIFPFEVTSLKSEFKDLGTNSAFNIVNSVNSTNQFGFSNFDEVNKIIKILEIKPSNISDYSNVIKASKYIGLDLAVSGVLEPKDDIYILEYKIIDVKNNKILKSIKTQSKNLFELHSRVALEIISINNKNIPTNIKNNLLQKSKDYKNIDTLNNLVKSYTNFKKYSYEGYDSSKIYAKKVLSSNKNIELANILSIKSNIFSLLQKKLDNLDFDIPKENIDSLLKELDNLKSDSYEIKKLRAYALYLKKDISFSQELKSIPDIYLRDEEIVFLKLLIKDYNPDNQYFKNLIEDNFIPSVLKATYFYKSKGKYDDAEELYKETLKVYSNNSSLLYGLGLIYFKTGRLDEAISKFSETVKLYPKFVDAYIYLGNSYKYSENYSKAIESYKKAIYHNKDKKDAYFELAKLYTEQGELNKAEENYKEVVRISPNDYQVHYHLATCYKLQDKLDEAIASYIESIKLKPDFVDAHYNLGIAYKYIGELEKAEASYKSALKIKSDFAEARLNLGVVYFEQDKINESIIEYQNAIKIKSDYPRAYNNMGSSYEKINKYTEALNSYKKAIELNPDYASAYYNLALLYKNKKMNKEAVENYKKACSLGYHPACVVKN